MELAKQVISLSLAKRLKELGVKQDSYFVYGSVAGNWLVARSDGLYMPFTSDTAAFTVAELGEMLYGKELPHSMGGSGYWETSEYYDLPEGRSRIEADTEAEARGLMLAYLVENKLITPNEEV